MSDTPAAKSKGGRPSTFTQAMADTICERLACGKSLRSICKADDVPSMATVMKWLGQQPSFTEQYARARETQADTIFDEIVDLADEAGYTNERIAKARLQIDARKWVAGKLRPKKYGEKHILGNDPENPLPEGKPMDVASIAQAMRIAKIVPAPEDGNDLL